MSQAEHNFQIDYIELPATDIEATKRFYNQVFGWNFRTLGQATPASTTAGSRVGLIATPSRLGLARQKPEARSWCSMPRLSKIPMPR